MNKLYTASAAALIAGAAPALAQDEPTIDVIHWLTAGAESAAVQILSDEVEARGGTWVDSAAPGGGADASAMLLTRIGGGDPPGASFLALGPDAQELGSQGALRDVREVAEANGLDQMAQVMVDISTAPGGELYALPIGLETQNLMYYNPTVFEEAGVEVPETWDAFLEAAPAIEEAGFIPIAVGAEGWQLGILLSSVIVGTGGADLYRSVIMDHDAEAAGGEGMVEAFTVMRALADASDPGSANRAWNDTLNLVAEGRAAMQVMGSWAGAELENMGLEYGTEWDCSLTPGSEAVVVEGAGFMFPLVDDPDAIAGQDLFIEVMMDPQVQADFAAVKGAVPPSGAADVSELSTCTQLAAEVLTEEGGGGLATISASNSSDAWGQMQDMLASFWSDPSMTPEAAAEQFASIIASQG
ncbi:ABC transporter substrate-binding protein [Pseudoroseicyclus tamaricis]|uniref:Carbohydrate ABC transporter substrate-binding protein n=1 Tax=Pseudoroseicyclus tamaricis TaxID=2705421 RepID=A0A6B2JTN4_9RHOB|nr:ABC transporter substrate-binding protein [Pseudoroseicyclus tamaricis]NDV01325.1 carbohydrate ABC transporter substrate-binding protein [Pseudoroseicyclus tamaricis]